VPPDTGWWYVFGSATAVAFVIQVVTGMALATPTSRRPARRTTR